jgi:hypothetical protein
MIPRRTAMLRRIAPLAIIAVSSIAVVGCGQSSTDAASASVTQYLHSLGSGDYTTACHQLSPSAAGQVAAEGINLGAPDQTCEGIYRFVLRTATETDRANLETAKVESIEMHGASATATVAGATEPISLEETDRGWKIASIDFSDR